MNKRQYGPTLLDLPISFFEHAFGKVPTQTTTLRRIVSTSYYRAIIETIRTELNTSKQDQLKKQLPAISPVALLNHRRQDTSFAQKIRYQWPLLMGDIDKKDNPGLDMNELKKHLSRLPYLVLCAYSVRGGLWFVVRLPDEQTPETLMAHFRYLQKLFRQKFGIVLDSTKGGNPTHLRFVSYDAAPFLNEQATIMAGSYTPPQSNASPPFRQEHFKKTDDGELLNRLLRIVEGAGEGQRHERLLKAAIVAGGYIGAGRLDEQTVIYRLETVASAWPTFGKSQKTIRDGIRYGLVKPLYLENIYERVNHVITRQSSSRTILPTAIPPIQSLAVSRIISPLIVRAITEKIIQPDSLPRKDDSSINSLTNESSDHYLGEWDNQSSTNAIPNIRAKSFHEFQCQHPLFKQMGLASLKSNL
jgi:hypothetical protein